MNYNVPHYFERKKITASDIMYLTRETPRTIITLLTGENLTTTIPMKEIASCLPEDDFLNISKGITLRKDQIVHISDDGLYTMTDGRIFQGRKRNISQHKRIRKSLNLPYINENNTNSHLPLDLLEKCSMLDEMPLAFCVIELVFDADGHGVDFIFHAAALKQVPSCEFFPIEAVKTNVLGTENVLQSAVDYGVKKVIMPVVVKVIIVQ